MNHDEMIAVIQHHKNGGKLQFRGRHGVAPAVWRDCGTPSWNFQAFDYRIKQEPLEMWCIISTETGQSIFYPCKEEAELELEAARRLEGHDLSVYKLVKFREVEDD